MTDKIGEMAWLDLSVKDADQVKDFYQSVIGWKAEAVSMGNYNDYTMMSPQSGDAVGGVCHAQGCNSDLPAAWLPYFLVENVAESVEQVLANGGEMITEIKLMGDDKYAVIKDPAGAVCAIYQKG
jgi:predicted enzyme related to lactoylglutathione lyase